MEFDEILTLLIGTTETKAKASELIETCRKFSMHQIEYINFDQDPLFNIGYNFSFNSPAGEVVRLEIIEKDGNLLQSGIQIIYKPSLFYQQINKDFSFIYHSLKSYYVNEQIQKFQGIKIYNFVNEESQCYISKSKANRRQVLNFKVTNKELWHIYNLFPRDYNIITKD